MSRKHRNPRNQAPSVAHPAATPVAQLAHDVVGEERTVLSERTFAASSSQNDPQSAEAQVAAEWKVGDAILDTYEVKHIHEGGGMGLVYRVYHRDWKEELAVKSPRPDYFATKEQRENFVRECVTWIGLGLHPHIVTCYYVRLLGGIPRVFAEYVAGGTLKDWIEGEDRKLYQGSHEQALERMLDVAIQFARGLHYAHEKGLLHQDVKPANVMITPEGIVKVTDFGLANARAVSGETVRMGSQQSIQLSCGRGYTPAFCSPEQAGKQPLTRRTDVWSWGVSVLEMFSGEVFWPLGTTAAAALETYMENGPEEDSIPQMPDGLVELLRECFQERETQRPRDLAVIVEHLKTIYQSTLNRSYTREESQETEATADVLNNQGLSFYNLGMGEEAAKCFEQAVKANPLHPEATYNRGVHLWRSGKMTSQEVISELRHVANSTPNNPLVEYMIALIHLERGDAGSAARIMKSGANMHFSEIGRALMMARDEMGQEWQELPIFEQHASIVSTVAISPNKRWVLSGCWKSFQLWELPSGKSPRTFEGHTDRVNSIAIGPNGEWVLSGSFDKTLRVWNVTSGECLRTLKGHTDRVNSVATSQDGRWGLSASADKTVRLWDLASGKSIRIFEGHTDRVNSVAISPNEQWLLSGSADNTLRLWDLANGECIRTFEGHNEGVNSVVISLDGRWGLSGSEDNTLRLWDLASGKSPRTFQGHTDRVNTIAIGPNGEWVLSGSFDKTLRLWNVSSGKCLRTLEGHVGTVLSVAVSRDGRWGISGSMDNTFRLWALDLPSYRAVMTPTKPQRVHELQKYSDQFEVAVKAAETHLQENEFDAALQNAKKARELHGYERHDKIVSVLDQLACRCKRSGINGAWPLRAFEGHNGHVESVAITPDGRWGLSGSEDGIPRDHNTLRLWDLASGQCLRIFKAHTSTVTSVSITPDGRWGLSGSWDKTVRLWDLASGQCLRTFDGHTNNISSVAISPNGRWGLSGSWDETIRFWDLASGQCLRMFKGHGKTAESVAINPNGRLVLSGDKDSTLRLWDVSRGRCLRTFEGHYGRVKSVAITPDGRWGLSGSMDNTLRLWDLASGKSLRTLEGHNDGVSSVAICPDGRWGLSGSWDKTLRIWDLANGHCLSTIEGHTDRVNSVAISPNGQWVLSGSADKTVRLWRLDWNYEFPGWADWDEGVRPYLGNFLTVHCQTGSDAFCNDGRPDWNEKQFNALINSLHFRGYGWLRTAGVRRELEKMSAEWKTSLLRRLTAFVSGKERKK